MNEQEARRVLEDEMAGRTCGPMLDAYRDAVLAAQPCAWDWADPGHMACIDGSTDRDKMCVRCQARERLQHA